MNGYAEMFWKNNEQSILKEVEKNIEKRNIQQEGFILCSFLLMLENCIKDLNQWKMLLDLIFEHLFRQVYACDELYPNIILYHYA